MHISASDPIVRYENQLGADAAITRTMPGFEIISAGGDTTNKYIPAIKFMSDDLQFTTESPKLLAGIFPRITEAYDGDTKGGMALDFATTPNTPGATNIPVIGMTLTEDSDLAIAGQIDITGSQDKVQLLVKANTGGQTADIVEVRDVAGSTIMTLDNLGNLDIVGALRRVATPTTDFLNFDATGGNGQLGHRNNISIRIDSGNTSTTRVFQVQHNTGLVLFQVGENGLSGNHASPISGLDIIGSEGKSFTTVTASTLTLDDTHSILYLDATSNNITITLPTLASSARRMYWFKRIDSTANVVTIDGDGAETIEGATSITIDQENESLILHSQTSDWSIF